MPSLDIVSEIDGHELTNAVDQANKEIANRYDFKGSNAQIEQSDSSVTLHAASTFQIQQMIPIIHQKLAKRGIDVSCLKAGKVEEFATTAKQAFTLNQGIDKEAGKKIVKTIKDSKLKVQAAVQGEQIRVTGKKRDDLQSVMALLKGEEIGLPIQFTNFRD